MKPRNPLEDHFSRINGYMSEIRLRENRIADEKAALRELLKDAGLTAGQILRTSAAAGTAINMEFLGELIKEGVVGGD